MSTTFAAFVSTGVTLAYSCVRLRNFCPHQQVSQTDWLFVIASPGAVYFSAKKNRNVREPLVSSHTIPV
jgi:hypothetical protein